ncbi:hypothetical protein [Actinokineospora bangkokensis]|uniref:DUF3558 domain-containing protein n=1 Tax=Actinokineospora bangkokensis TaxID=1193682 RepID=A0A1Q9LRK4_9PSEU|nr:hypothetical protein [Actinokineospora bangkokensis]OLR94659.1 hypothetical protein BJP25_13135 [Actinokineospora bangkokensis]
MNRALVAVAAVALLGLGACTKTTSAAPVAPGQAVPGQADSGAPAVSGCDLLEDAEVKAVLGSFEKHTEGLGCSWENQEDYHSVTVTIGGTGTAPGGEFPDLSVYGTIEPAPDGMRYASGNVLFFTVDDRLCDVQVVTDVSDDSDRPTAVKFARLVRERMG